jgi:putative peptide zinc metalloprotease protein
MKRYLILLFALLAALTAAPQALADDHDRDPDVNTAVVINQRSDSSLFDFAFSIRRIAGDVVDQENVALAYSSCERCRSVAIAIQIVLAHGSPSTVTPQNVAVAVNENCTACETFAAAYQFVITGGTELEFTKEGKKELKRIVREIRRLNDPDLSLEEIRTRLDALIARLRVVLKTQLVPKRERGDDDDDDDERDEDEDRPAPRVTTTGETETEPAQTTSTESTPTETTETEPVETATTTTETTTTETVPTQTTP